MTLLSVAEFRGFVTSSLGDDELEVLLAAAEAAIDALYGPVGSSVTDVCDGGESYIFLRRRASSVSAVRETSGETETTLAADDYRLRGDGVSLLRLATGTNARTYWGIPVEVDSVPASDVADRKRVQLALVQQDLNYSPGSVRERIGEWEEEHNQGSSVWNYETERAAILGSLSEGVPGSAPGFA